MKVELRDIVKIYGSLRANDGISMTIEDSTIVGILGENGAGKSTLMKGLSGFIRLDGGEILIDGQRVLINSPADSLKCGIGMLHQDPLDIPSFRLIDNFILGRPAKMSINRHKAVQLFRTLAERFGFVLDPFAWVDGLTVGERQQLEILRLLSLGAKILILDEPTTGISLPQKIKLFATLKALAAEGMSVLLVTHKLEDADALCSKAVVLRQGQLVGSMEKPFSAQQMIGLMFGKELPVPPPRNPHSEERCLNVDSLGIDSARLQVRNACVDLCEGEVIGLAGMEGSGQSLFLSACAGLEKPVEGIINLKGEDLTRANHHDFRRKGVAFVPAARLEQALIPGMTIAEHVALAAAKPDFFLNTRKLNTAAQEKIDLYHIKGQPESPIESLSGGNQQRALLALMRDSLRLILLEHPTRGLDIESTAYIWQRLKDRCSHGTSIIFLSSDLDEIIEYSDKVVVFFSGRMSPVLEATSLHAEELGSLIGGAGWDRFKVQQSA